MKLKLLPTTYFVYGSVCDIYTVFPKKLTLYIFVTDFTRSSVYRFATK